MRSSWIRLRLLPRAAWLGLLLLLPASYASAQHAPGCLPGTPPQWAASFADLRNSLGDAIGSPVGCAQTDDEGNTIQATTTGLAIYRPSGMALFASGDEHWALTPDGLETWTGNWHNGLEPPVSPSPRTADADGTATPLASVQAFTVVGVARQDPPAAVVEGDTGRRYTLETAAECGDVLDQVGGRVYLRWLGPAPGPGSTLIRVDRRESCALTALQPAAQ